MANASVKSFDSVRFMREQRERISAEISGMSYEEMARWFRSRRYTDPTLRELAEESARRGAAEDKATAGR